jgi:acyl-CoA synthetase (AMP-forming)/AMP-acid ligase II/acyl carrier protein
VSHPTLWHRLVDRLERAEPLTLRSLRDDGRTADERTLEELVAGARAVAAGLRADGLRRGDRVALCFLPSLDFVEALLACQLLGVVPAPVLPPDPSGSDVQRLTSVCDSSGAKAVLTHKAYHRLRLAGRLARLARLRRGARWPDLPWRVTDAYPRGERAPLQLPADDELALLQYTSGSTGTPKGIRVPHRALAHNLDLLCELNTIGRDSHLLMWLPLYHDMGLIGCTMTMLWQGEQLSMLSPLAFMAKPMRWMEQLSARRATHTAAPNFAFDLVVRKATPAAVDALDLSAMQMVVCGAETIRADTVDRFYATFRPAGLRAGTFSPCYGLAENVIAVTNRGQGRVRVDVDALAREQRLVPSEGEGGRELVGCGTPRLGVHVRIVDPVERRVLPDGSVGEIWVRSPSTCDGYEGAPQATARTFAARTVPDDGHDWLRTGDLGALHDGELYPTGRCKELLIVRGRNLAPDDVEVAARAAHGAVRPGGVAACGLVHQGTEALAVVVEIGAEHDLGEVGEAVATAVRRAVAEATGVGPQRVYVGPKGLVPKTTSGKTRRLALAESILRGDLSGRRDVHERIVGSDEALQPVTERGLPLLREVVGGVLGAPPDDDTPLAELGIDSVAMMQLKDRLEVALGEPVPADRVLGARTLRDLGERLGLVPVRRARTQPPSLWTETWQPVRLEPAASVESVESPNSDLTVVDGRDDPEQAAEQCRRLLSSRAGPSQVVVLTAGAVSSEGPAVPASAALWGFVRSLRTEDPTRRWRLRDLSAEAPLSAAGLRDPRPELRIDEVAWRPVLTEHDAEPASDALPWGGRVRLAGEPTEASWALVRWLVAELGVSELVLDAPDAPDGPDAQQPALDALFDAGVTVRSPDDQPVHWLLYVPGRADPVAAARATTGRRQRARQGALAALQQLVSEQPVAPAGRIVVVSDAAALVGPSGQSVHSSALHELAAWVRGRPDARLVALGPHGVDARALRKTWRPLAVGPLPDPAVDASWWGPVLRSSGSCVGVWPPAT